MSGFEYRLIYRCTDRQLLTFFEKLENDLSFSPVAIKVYGAHESINKTPENTIFNEILKKKGSYITWAHATRNRDTGKAYSITFERGEKKTAGQPVESSLYIDTIQIGSQQHIDVKTALKINDFIDEILISKSAPTLERVNDDRTLKNLVETHHQLIGKFHEQISLVGDDFVKERIKLEGEFGQRKKQLDSEFEQLRIGLRGDYERQFAELESERALLGKREQELDDRHNTHVRRQLRQDLKDRLASYKEKFELTEGTRNLRRPVWIAVVAIEIVCVALLVFFFSQIPNGGDIWDRVAFWGKSIALTFFGVATAVWYLKWLTQWSTRHADAEFQLKQFELDIDRASWVVETAFEWKSTQESSIPQPLLDAISRNLFAGGDPNVGREESPADHLASALLGEASKLTVKLGENSAEWDRKGIRGMQNTK